MDLWKVAVDGGVARGAPELLHRNIGRMWPRGLTAAGSYYYHETVGTVDVYDAQLAGDAVDKPTALPTRFAGSNISSIWSPDGSHLAYASRRGPVRFDRGSTTVVIRDLRTQAERELIPAMKSFLLRSWSPDDRRLL